MSMLAICVVDEISEFGDNARAVRGSPKTHKYRDMCHFSVLRIQRISVHYKPLRSSHKATLCFRATHPRPKEF
jgi:hypothetical protein